MQILTCSLSGWKGREEGFCIIKSAAGDPFASWIPEEVTSSSTPLGTHLSVYEIACQILERFECECIHGHADCIAYAAELKEERDLWPLHDDGHATNAAAAATAAASADANAAVAAAADADAAAAAAVMLMSLGHDGALICPGVLR